MINFKESISPSLRKLVDNLIFHAMMNKTQLVEQIKMKLAENLSFSESLTRDPDRMIKKFINKLVPLLNIKFTIPEERVVT